MIQLFGGELLRNIRKKEGARPRLVIPPKLRETVMELSHELPSAGHQGTGRTLSKVKDKYHWYNMSRDIRTFVLTCEVCSKHKKSTRNARCHMTPYHAGAPDGTSAPRLYGTTAEKQREVINMYS